MPAGTPPWRNPIFCALDTGDLAVALDLAAAVTAAIGGLKVGLELFAAAGPGGVARLGESGAPLFLDLKLHDIPNTVAGAMRSLAPLRPALVTVHAAGGAAMLRAAVDAAPSTTRVLAVTVLTSLDENDLDAVGQRRPLAAQVERLARLAEDAGLAGIVCSPHEAAALRGLCRPGFLLVVPGIRPAGAGAADQKRTMTPREALRAGADILVIGRPITEAAHPAEAARALALTLGAEPAS